MSANARLFMPFSQQMRAACRHASTSVVAPETPSPVTAARTAMFQRRLAVGSSKLITLPSRRLPASSISYCPSDTTNGRRRFCLRLK
jgi:hypothetical protein